jgi:peptide/nickel transport system permease protein
MMDFAAFKSALLWTDLLLFGLVLALAGLVWHIRRHAHLAAPWRKVAMSRAGMVSATLLAVFATIGLLDSLHYRPALPEAAGAGQGAPGKSATLAGGKVEVRYAVELRSALDRLLDPLPDQVETTYSAPLATRAFNKTAIEGGPGGTVRDYPRLKFGGAH